jgi:hypothetical protein
VRTALVTFTISGTYEDYMEHYRLTHQREEQWIT